MAFWRWHPCPMDTFLVSSQLGTKFWFGSWKWSLILVGHKDLLLAFFTEESSFVVAETDLQACLSKAAKILCPHSDSQKINSYPEKKWTTHSTLYQTSITVLFLPKWVVIHLSFYVPNFEERSSKKYYFWVVHLSIYSLHLPYDQEW